jgi:hypothetical protein
VSVQQKKKRIGELLVEIGFIDALQLRAALKQKEQWGKPLGRTLVEMRLITEDQLIAVLSEQLKLPTVDLSLTAVDPAAVALVDEDFCREHQCLPFAYYENGKFLDVAMSEAQDQLLYDTLRVRTRCNIRPFLAGPDSIQDAMERAFGRNLEDVELQFQLSESLFDFGDENESRHVDPAVRTTPTPSDGSPAVDPRRPTPSPQQRARTATGTPAVPGRARTGMPPAVSAPTVPPRTRTRTGPVPITGSQPAVPPRARTRPGPVPITSANDPSFTHDPYGQTGPRWPAVPEPPMEASFSEVAPVEDLPLPPAGPAPAPDSSRVIILEQLLASTVQRLEAQEQRLERQEEFLKRVLLGVREVVGQLAQVGLVQLPDDHPLKPSTSPGQPVVQRAAPAAAPPRQAAPPPRQAAPQPPAAQPRPPPPAAAARPAAEVDGGRVVEAPPKPPASEIRAFSYPPKEPAPQDPGFPLLELPPGAQAAVAMDFGTTRSSVATVIDGRVVVLRLPGGDWDIPSVVGFRNDGSVMLGKAARKMLASDAENAIASPKRLLGRRFDEPGLGPYLAQLGMKATAGPKGDILLTSRGRKLPVTEACSHMLKLLQLVAEKNLGHPVRDVILTVPVTSGERPLRALSEAAAKAGLRVLEFLHEPVAAAMACVFDEACDGLIAVYDFGGGTFDFSVVDLGGGSMQVVASSGDSWLGGDDLDQALASAAANALWQQTKVELRNQADKWQQLLFCAEQAKRDLSTAEETVLRLPDAIRTAKGEADFEWPISRRDFAKLVKGIIDRSLESCQEALAQARLTPRDLNTVYLSGGTSYVPAVRDAVAAYFDLEPRVVIPPERMVVVGAAVHGALVQRSE